MNNLTNSKLVKWLKNPRPETTLANWLREKRLQALEERKKLISHVAYKLWEEDGKPDIDRKYYWFKAIEKSNSETTSALLFSKLLRLGYGIEQPLEKGLAFLKSLAILEILGILGNITIVIAVISFIATEKQRRDAEVYQAWQVITAAYGQPGSGGRKEALEFLNSEPRRIPLFWLKWERQNLAGLAAPNAYLEEVNLQKAQLRKANLQKASLESAQLQQAKLYRANLQEASLESAQLQQASLGSAQLQQAVLRSSNLYKAKLYRANLQEADLEGVNLEEAKLYRANLRKANLEEASLEEAKLYRANLRGTYLGAVQKHNYNQIKSACFWEQAIYKGEWNSEQKSIIIEPENTSFIEKLQKDTSSDPKNPPDCSFWNK